MNNICFYFLLFFIYCIIGYLLECLYCTIMDGEIEFNRGFLVGPYLPIYGTGAVCISLLLKKYEGDPIALFAMGCLICTLIEYLASYIMEKVFKARWWDYSDKKLNVNGRVCLLNSFLFGIGSVAVMYVNPFLTRILRSINPTVLIWISLICLLIFLSDLIISISTIYNLRLNSICVNKDLTGEISEQVKKVLLKSLHLKRRLLYAFPRTKQINPYNRLREFLDNKK